MPGALNDKEELDSSPRCGEVRLVELNKIPKGLQFR